MMKRYRRFIVKKFGKENDPQNEDGSDNSEGSADDKWRRTDDFTNVFPKRQSVKKFLAADRLSSRSASKSKHHSKTRQSNNKRMLNRSLERSFSGGRSLNKSRE